jgi:hypothetical protein
VYNERHIRPVHARPAKESKVRYLLSGHPTEMPFLQPISPFIGLPINSYTLLPDDSWHPGQAFYIPSPLTNMYGRERIGGYWRKQVAVSLAQDLKRCYN